MEDLKVDMITDQDETWMGTRKRLEALLASRRFTREKQQKEVPDDHGVINREAHDDQEVKILMNSHIYQSIKMKDNGDVFIGTLETVSLWENLSVSAILRQVTHSGSSSLHVAARYGSGDVIQLLAHFIPKLIFRRNNLGDTPLHEATRAGQLNATKMLIPFAKDNEGKDDDSDDYGDPFVSRKNHKWNTALHLAVIHRRLDVANFLVLEDPEGCYSLNKGGRSPLCLAVRNLDTTMLGCLLDTLIESSPWPICDKVQGWRLPPVHLAMKKKAMDKLNLIATKEPELLRVRYEKGENPLHCAAWLGYDDGVEFMLQKASGVEVETNKDGRYPIDLACKRGHVRIVKKLLQQRIMEEPAQCLNRKGQNILHIAAENGQNPLITYIFKNIEGDMLKKLLNQRDNDGNTPLHVATIQGYFMSVYALVNAKGMTKNLRNNKMLTAYAIASARAMAKDKQDDTKQELDRNKQLADADTPMKSLINEKRQSTTESPKCSINYYSALMTFAILHFHAPPKRGRRTVVETLRKLLYNSPNIPELNWKMDNLLVVAILIAGATFASALQLPQDKSVKNPKGLAGHTCIIMQAYLILNMVTLNLSVFASVLLCWTSVLSCQISRLCIGFASVLVSWSIYLMCVAFSLALIIDLANYIQSFAVVLTLLVFLLGLQSIVVIPFVFPDNLIRSLENALTPYFYYLIARFYLLFHLFLSKMED